MHAISSLQVDFVVDSPGRINLIGGHTDYNNGFVLPAAIDKKIQLGFRKKDDEHRCTIYSKGYDHPLEIDLRKIQRSETLWENYILGVIDQIHQLGKKLHGFECTIESNLPIGSGLSSSAALECGLASGLNELFQLGLTQNEIVLLSMKAEHGFVGTKCGIMDQFAAVFGKKDHVLLLDCSDMQFRYIPAVLDPYSIVVLNTNVSHQLSDGQYNSRRDECFEAAGIIQKTFPQVSFLRDVDKAMLETCKADLPSTLYNRARFIVEENQRVQAASQALESGNIKELGDLIYDCHDGLRHLYEISCPELDFLVDYGKEKDYVVGSRVMGGGFGGSTINLVHKNNVGDYVPTVSKAYAKEFGIELSAFEVAISEGTAIKHVSR